MIVANWVLGLLRRRRGRVLGAAAGVALAVALLGSLGSFLASAKSAMTRRAIEGVGVDWQVEVQPGADPAAVAQVLSRDHRVRADVPIDFAPTTGLQSTVGGTTQSTGAGQLVRLLPNYTAAFPREVRVLVGASHGVLLAQQTAANLHAGPGDTVNIGLNGLAAVPVRVDGVVDLPNADSLFQHVGAPPGAQATAPPDNVVLLGADAWTTVVGPLTATRPDLVRHQFHLRLDHRLAHDPAAAFAQVTGSARNFEANVAGAALVGDNLGAALDAARSDALYAQVLFALLGLPGAVLAGLLTRAVATSGASRRRRELALLRTRGATRATLGRLVAAEAVLIAAIGGAAGLVAAGVVGRVAFGSATFGTTTASAAVWAGASLVAGAVIAVTAVLLPARRDAAEVSVAAARGQVGRRGRPAALRWGLDLWILAGAALVFWLTSRSGYNLVLAPEGVPTLSVNYWSLAGPLLLWVGAGLAAWRLSETLLGRGRPLLRRLLRPFTGGLTAPVTSSLHRQRRVLATGIVLIGLTSAFALSTAAFNATYRHQVGVDALLTNGAPVTVTAFTGTPVDTAAISRVRGVKHVEALQHRFAYVGADLQDLYGVDPATIAGATSLQDAYFVGGTARTLMAQLTRHPDSVLLSAETVHDFQLHPGDTVRLRLPDAHSGQLHELTFRFAGVVKEFPTAPRDSFIIANAAYVAAQTHDTGSPLILVDTVGASATSVAARVRTSLGSSVRVTDIDTSRRVVGSSLTAVDLGGLTKVELGFAVVLAAAAAGLVLALGLAERRRSFAIIAALGARSRQLGAFVWGEAVVVAVAGCTTGAAGGWLLAHMLVKVLTGVFDPPPSQLQLPWLYISAVAVLAVASIAVAAEGTIRAARRPAMELLREL